MGQDSNNKGGRCHITVTLKEAVLNNVWSMTNGHFRKHVDVRFGMAVFNMPDAFFRHRPEWSSNVVL